MSREHAAARGDQHRGGTGTAPLPIARVANHLWAMGVSDELRQYWRRTHRPAATMIDAKEVIQVLNAAGVRFVLMGAHAISGWRDEPRATQDVDILVPKRHHRKAVAALQQAYPDLTVEDLPVVTRFIDPATEKPAIDLIKPVELVHQAVFKHTIQVGKTHRIPDLEMAMICKYAAMISPNRRSDKKYLDAGDFVNMLQTNQDQVDVEKLRQLGETVYHGGDEVVKFVEDIKAGRPLKL